MGRTFVQEVIFVSRIDDLIARRCPQGIEFRLLGDVVRIRNGKDYRSLGDGVIPVYGTGGIMTHVNTAVYDKPSVLIPRKGSLSKLYYVDQPFWTVDTIFYTEVGNRLVPKFFYYYLATQHLEDMNQAGGVPSLTQAVLNVLRIPVPPLEVQREIVCILDTFAELEAELEARRKQYDYYRRILLSFDVGVRRSPLGELAFIGTGSRNTNEAIIGGSYPFFVRSQEPLAINEYEFDEAAVITAGDGVGVGKVFHLSEGKYALHQRAYRVVPTSAHLLPKFLYHWFKEDFARYLATNSVHASVTSLRKPMFENYPVPVPGLDEQMRIVNILDNFDALVSDLSIGLPAELSARRRQYEHYRDCLLTFNEALG
jgi:type I restriction enzyme S subunit